MKKLIKLIGVGFLIFMVVLPSCKKDEIPTISTFSITNITDVTASGGGLITSDGGAEVSTRGVCYSTQENPTTLDPKTTDGNGTGQFISSLTGLDPGSLYHVRAYATNSVGTSYGADLSFSTLGQVPEALPQLATNILTTSVTLNGTVNANYVPTIVTFEYGVTTSYGQTVTASQSPVSGNSLTNVTAYISGLSEGTTYHFRIKTVNSLGTTFSTDIMFTTLGQMPEAITQSATNISVTGATLNGTVNANYLSTTVTFEYGTTTSYGQTVIAVQSPVTGNSAITISAAISDLNQGTTYHFRIKAVNSLGTAYGEDETFTTLNVPTLSTTHITVITNNSAQSGGSIISSGGAAINLYGVCWSISPNPTVADSHSRDGTGTGSFVSNITGLSKVTNYYVRAYAVNSVGTAYGDELSFYTGTGPINFNPNLTYRTVSDMDGNVYKTIQIGTQTWMAENLKTTRYRDGTVIPFADWAWVPPDGTYLAGFGWFQNNESAFKDTYGAYYNWTAVNIGKLCPDGWHVPSTAEYLILDQYLGGGDIAGGKLKEEGTSHWEIPNTSADNSSGFTALPLPGGYREDFTDAGENGTWWSSTNMDREIAKGVRISHLFGSFYGEDYFVESGRSVRCLKD
jgi:uncharacterized protein (TIGR02145 family)